MTGPKPEPERSSRFERALLPGFASEAMTIDVARPARRSKPDPESA